MRSSKSLAVLSLLSSALASDVLTLTSATFGSSIQPEPLVLVEFYGKALAPEYEKAATELKNESIKLAKIDCTAEADLCNAHGVNGYPTLKIFRKGEASEYGGSRKADGIVSYMKKQALPAVQAVTASDHAAFTASDRIVMVAYLEESDETNKQTYTEFADGHRDDYLFGLATDSAVFATAKVEPPTVVLYKTFDEGRNDFAGSLTSLGLADFLKQNSVPLFDEISPENFNTYADSGIPLAYVFVEETDSNRESLVKSLEPVARKHKGKVNFVWIDAAKFSDHAKSLNLQEPVWPSFAIQEVTEGQKYPMSQSATISAETVGDFVDKFVAGEIKPSVKSEPIPSTQTDAAYTLVADEFDKVTGDNSRDMFVEFYAPWCGHCKKLAPTWETLGERFAHAKDKLLIAKFDAHNNDVPPSAGIKIQGFPTIKFKQAGSSTWLDYQGDRSLDSFLDFVEQNAANKGIKPSEASDNGSGAIVMGTEDDDEDDEEMEAVHDEL